MNNLHYAPHEVMNAHVETGVAKTEKPLYQVILLGIMAGAFIALGGSASSVAAHTVANVGMARLVTGVIFPVGLMMVVFTGGELFTGNCLIFMAVLDKKITVGKKIQNLVVVYFSNFAGAFVVDVLVFFSGQMNYSEGGVGAYAIKAAVGKVAMTPIQSVCSGILCNMLVCLAILMASASKDIAGKVWAIFFPICTFLVAGFEHCVANMYYLPTAMLAASNPAYVARAGELYGITPAQCEGLTVLSSLRSLAFVTVGNIIGGVFFIGAMYYLIYIRKTGE